MVLGASGWRVFWQIDAAQREVGFAVRRDLCNARAMGLVPCRWCPGTFAGSPTPRRCIEILYGEYQFAAAFAVAAPSPCWHS